MFFSPCAPPGNSPNGRAMPGVLRLLWDVILREPRQVVNRAVEKTLNPKTDPWDEGYICRLINHKNQPSM